MSKINLIVGGIEVPVQASHTIEQKYVPVLAETILRMEDRSAFKQTLAGNDRMIIETNGTGHIPLSLQAIDYRVSFDIACCSPLIKHSSTNVIAIPFNSRLDVSPVGYAIVNGVAIRTSLSIAGNTAVISSVLGATAYQLAYFPIYTVFAQRPTEQGAARSANSRVWQLICEEI